MRFLRSLSGDTVRLKYQTVDSGPDRHNQLMPAHTGYNRHNTGPGSKILFLY